MGASSHVAPLVGIDVTAVARVAEVVERNPRFTARVFTEVERRDSAGRPERWASRWAAKEAVRKLYGAQGISPLPAFHDIEVTIAEGGAPRLRVAGAATEVTVSLSHDGGMAVAVAVAMPDPLSRRTWLPAPPGVRLAARPADGHKGTFGTVVVLAGAHGLSGAAYLSAMGAARGGAGLVRLCVPAQLHPALTVKCTEVMPHALPDGGLGITGEEAIEALLPRLACPTVIDADGLNLIASGLALHPGGVPVVVTPHPAEMGRLAGIATSAVQADRRGVASQYATAHGVVVVLKGSRTVVAAPDGRLHEDGHAVVALASGGTGDVLAGLIGAMLAAGLDAFDAAVAAVVIHAEAGAAVQAGRGRAGGLASDVLEALPAAQERLRRALETRDKHGGGAA
jgi:phosphopantetheine--protein transferase-like protein